MSDFSGSSSEAGEDNVAPFLDDEEEVEPDDGEDLMDTLERDYQAIPELDEFEQDGLDDAEYEEMDHADRMRLDRMLDARDARSRGPKVLRGYKDMSGFVATHLRDTILDEDEV